MCSSIIKAVTMRVADEKNGFHATLGPDQLVYLQLLQLGIKRAQITIEAAYMYVQNNWVKYVP